MIAPVVAGRGVAFPGVENMLPAGSAGAMGAFCIVIFYLALSCGPISIVAPVLAASACIPVIYGLVTGERPSGLQLTGLALTLTGVILVSIVHDSANHARGRRGIGFAVIAAVLLGSLLVVFSRASAVDPYWAPLVLRVFSLATVAIFALVRRVSVRVERRGGLVIAFIGILDMVANLAYSVATTLQLLAIVAVLSSLFPVVTVALARFHLESESRACRGRGRFSRSPACCSWRPARRPAARARSRSCRPRPPSCPAR